MKKIVKILGIFYLFVFAMLIIGVFILIAAMFNYNTSIFNEKYYETIEELHNDYVAELNKAYNDGASSTDYYPEEIVDYFEESDDVFVICTYSSSIDRKIIESSLYVYVVKKDDKSFYLEIADSGVTEIYFAIIPLNDDYNGRDYDWYYTEYKNKEYKVCYGFAYKNIKSNYELYFDDGKMNEVKCMNPFSGEEFILCYATSNKVYNFFEMLFVPKDERHTLKIK